MTARYKVLVPFKRDDRPEVLKRDTIIELPDEEADGYIDAGWVEFVEEAEGEKPDETAPPVPLEPTE